MIDEYPDKSDSACYFCGRTAWWSVPAVRVILPEPGSMFDGKCMMCSAYDLDGRRCCKIALFDGKSGPKRKKNEPLCRPSSSCQSFRQKTGAPNWICGFCHPPEPGIEDVVWRTVAISSAEKFEYGQT